MKCNTYGKGKKDFDRPTNSLGILFSQFIDGLMNQNRGFVPILQLNARFPAPGAPGATLIPRFKRHACVCAQYY